MILPNNRLSVWAGPSIGGTKAGLWGPWNTSEGLIVKAGESRQVTLKLSSVSDAPSSYDAEIRYFNGREFVTELHTISGEGSVDVFVRGGDRENISTVKFRLKSHSLGQNVTVDSGNIAFAPGALPFGETGSGLNEKDIAVLMNSSGYRSGNKDIHEVVKEWFGKKYGAGPQKLDATGKPVRPVPVPPRKPAMTPSSGKRAPRSAGGGPVHVRAHTRESGSEKVRAHTRSRPEK